jgi:hypothetical protein
MLCSIFQVTILFIQDQLIACYNITQLTLAFSTFQRIADQHSRFAESRFAESRFAECRRRTSNFDVGLLAYRKTSNKRPRHLFVQICLSSRRLMETGVKLYTPIFPGAYWRPVIAEML